MCQSHLGTMILPKKTTLKIRNAFWDCQL
jgi:hypothetical protein